MVRENSNTTPYLTNETKDICKLTLWYYYFTFCGRLISIENSCNTTIRENTSIMTNQLIIIIIEGLLILLFVRIVVLFITQIINMLMSLNKTKQIILLLFVHIYLFRKLIKVFVLALFVKIVLGFFLLILLVLILILMLILIVIFG